MGGARWEVGGGVWEVVEVGWWVVWWRGGGVVVGWWVVGGGVVVFVVFVGLGWRGGGAARPNDSRRQAVSGAASEGRLQAHRRAKGDPGKAKATPP